MVRLGVTLEYALYTSEVDGLGVLVRLEVADPVQEVDGLTVGEGVVELPGVGVTLG